MQKKGTTDPRNLWLFLSGSRLKIRLAQPVKIHTYYSDLGWNHEGLIELWARSWRDRGWEPVVLGEEHAARHPLYGMLKERYAALPSINSKDYELACYLRWPAMAAEGGGFLCDYDVMNYGFPPAESFLRSIEQGQLQVYTETVCPCFVGGNRAAFELAALLFAAWIPDSRDIHKGERHASDQEILRRAAWLFSCEKRVWRCGNPGWEEADLVHYSYAATQGASKASFIQEKRAV